MYSLRPSHQAVDLGLPFEQHPQRSQHLPLQPQANPAIPVFHSPRGVRLSCPCESHCLFDPAQNRLDTRNPFNPWAGSSLIFSPLHDDPRAPYLNQLAVSRDAPQFPRPSPRHCSTRPARLCELGAVQPHGQRACELTNPCAAREVATHKCSSMFASLALAGLDHSCVDQQFKGFRCRWRDGMNSRHLFQLQSQPLKRH